MLSRSEELQKENSPKYSNFQPEVCTEKCSESSLKFRALFLGKRRPLNICQKSPPFFSEKLQQIHRVNPHVFSGEGGKVNVVAALRIHAFIGVCVSR